MAAKSFISERKTRRLHDVRIAHACGFQNGAQVFQALLGLLRHGFRQRARGRSQGPAGRKCRAYRPQARRGSTGPSAAGAFCAEMICFFHEKSSCHARPSAGAFCFHRLTHPYYTLPFPPPAQPRGCAAAPSNSRTRRIRRRAVCNGRLVTRVAACNASAACKAVRPVCFFPARLRRASRAPCLYLAFEPRTHAVFPGAGQRRASVIPGLEKAWLLFPAAGRKPAPKLP